MADNSSAATPDTGSRNPNKRKKDDSSPDLLSKPVDIRNHCKKKCTSRSEAIQCDFCSAWVHAACEGLSKDDYSSLNQLISDTENVVYYCKLNQCLTRVKKLIFDHSQNFSSIVTNTIESLKTSWQEEFKVVNDSIATLSKKIDNLGTQNSELQLKVNNTEASINTISTNPVNSSLTQTSATSIVDEYLERERRKLNLIVYGLIESSAPTVTEQISSDTDIFCRLVRSEFNMGDIQVGKVLRLGKVVRDKPRPVLVSLTDFSTRRQILRNAKSLRNSQSYKQVFICPDLTPKERETNKQLVEELRRRKQAGESNLIIQRGKIVMRSSSSTAMDTNPGN